MSLMSFVSWYWQLYCHWGHWKLLTMTPFNTLRPRQDGRHFPDDIFRCIFLNENTWIAINISLSFVPKGPIDNIPALVQIMAWHRSGDKPLSEPMMVSLPTHICITRPQWVNAQNPWGGHHDHVKDSHWLDYKVFNMNTFLSRWRYQWFCIVS